MEEWDVRKQKKAAGFTWP